jgi:hypothetical protein
MNASGTELVCPGCGARVDAQHGRPRFCPDCHLPLVFDDAPESGVLDEVSERRRRARLIKPQLAEGPLVKVAWVRNQAEGEFLQGLLLEEGVPSLLRRTAGFDVPDMLAAGPRDVMVAASGVDIARDMLLEAGAIRDDAAVPARVRPGPLLCGLLLALAFGALFIWLISLGVH